FRRPSPNISGPGEASRHWIVGGVSRNRHRSRASARGAPGEPAASAEAESELEASLVSEDRIARLKERDRAMREARDEILRRVEAWLRGRGFDRAGVGHFARPSGSHVCHVGFQKKTSGRSVRIMCHITAADSAGASIDGPWSDPDEGRDAPNGKRYQFGWSTREPDMARCAAEYCRYLEEVVFEWFDERLRRGR
ncbi:hypothetical protein HK102_011666, partial [Quaeritorhiza haematococci]